MHLSLLLTYVHYYQCANNDQGWFLMNLKLQNRLNVQQHVCCSCRDNVVGHINLLQHEYGNLSYICSLDRLLFS